jgi:light-regulated signal transduction histidine kinase (bacteriophytochrome)
MRPEEERLLDGFADGFADALIAVTPNEGRIVYWSSAAETLFGYAREEVLGRSLVEVLVPAVAESRKTEAERKKMEVALRLANAELEAFSHSVAHDLRAPLRGLSGFAQILLEECGDQLTASGVDCLHEIRENALRMNTLIDALLSLSQVSRAELHSQRIDMAFLARAAIERLKASEPERIVEVVVPPHLWAQVDAQLARTLVDNLLGNAWKFTGKTPLARIEVGVAEVDAESAFFVRDNGAGFDMEYTAKLFAPFQRLHSTAEFGGVGVGLASAQRIVHRHSGRIWALGAVGKGATFYFTLPTMPEEVAGEAPSSSRRSGP